MKRHATVIATGRYVPARTVTNAEIEARLGQPVDAWLREKVGIAERHYMADSETTSDLAVAAARQAMERAGLSPADLDLIIVAGDTPDQPSPGTASVVQHKLGAHRAGTYDVNCACASFVTAMDVAGKTIAADEDYTHVLVVGVYAMSRYLDWTDKTTCTLFADGAGAVILRASPEPGLIAGRLRAFGEYHDALGIYAGGARRPATLDEVTQNGRPRVQFVRKLPATFNLERWPELVRATVDKAKLRLDDVALYVFTQLNARTIEACMADLGQPMARTHMIMDKWGYTGSACIPMALDDAIEHGKVRRGDHVVLCASGGGVAMASVALRWTM